MRNMKLDALIILGGGITQDDDLKKVTIQRLKKGISVFKKNDFSYIIVAGAYGFMEKYFPLKTEAKAMLEYLEKKELPKEKIILEEKSKETIGNIYFTKVNILEPKKLYKLVVVTSDFHMPRTKYIFKKVLGIKYKLFFVDAPSDLSRKVLKKKQITELILLRLFKRWTNKMNIGDEKFIKKFLYTKHPAYSRHPKITKEQLSAIVEGKVSIK